MNRTYDFDVPYTINGFVLSMGWNQIAVDPMFHRLPMPVQHKIAHAHLLDQGVTLTQEDLDSIPDDVWAHIAAKLGLSYS